MKFRLHPLILALLVSSTLSAQKLWDYGVKFSAANYLGEIGGKDGPRRDFLWDMKLGVSKAGSGAFARRQFNRYVALNIGFNYGRISGADSLTIYEPRKARNLNFRNDIFELSARAELYPYTINDFGTQSIRSSDLKTYLFAGIGVFNHNPKGERLGEWHELRPLKTEGQKEEYNRFEISIPVGLGVLYTYRHRWRYGWEFSWHKTFTDYLDDVSTFYPDPADLDPANNNLAAKMSNRTGEVADWIEENFETGLASFGPGQVRGSPKYNDAFLFTTFTVSYVLRGKSIFYRQKYSWLTNKRARGRKTRAKF